MFQCVAPEFLKKKTGGEIRLEELKKEAKRIGVHRTLFYNQSSNLYDE